MAGGQALNTLVDLFLATSPTTLTAIKMIENEASFRTTLLRQIMRAHDMSQQIQGGSEIQASSTSTRSTARRTTSPWRSSLLSSAST